VNDDDHTVTLHTRPDVHERFVAIVARGTERAAREYAEHLASLRESPDPSAPRRRAKARRGGVMRGRRRS
jgi:hypothetical protein